MEDIREMLKSLQREEDVQYIPVSRDTAIKWKLEQYVIIDPFSDDPIVHIKLTPKGKELFHSLH